MKTALAIFVMVASLIMAGCGRRKDEEADAPRVHKHEHVPPHGGTAVVLGDEFCHVEFVRDRAAGRLQAYVLDGELENFIRVVQPSVGLEVRMGGESRMLALSAVANTATGETVGDTALFEVQAEWLKTTPEFNAVLKALAVRGTRFENIAFNFPRGNDANRK